MGTPEQVAELAQAMWQLLDDMGLTGMCVCGEAKARARIAYEPFIDAFDDMQGIMPLNEAERIVADVEQTT